MIGRLTARLALLGLLVSLGISAATAAGAVSAVGIGGEDIEPGGHSFQYCGIGYLTRPEDEAGIFTSGGVELRYYTSTPDVWNGYRAWFHAQLPNGVVAEATIASSRMINGRYTVRNLENVGPATVTYHGGCPVGINPGTGSQHTGSAPSSGPRLPRGTISGPKRTHRSRVSFRFTSSEEDSQFKCRLDQAPFARCASPYEAHRLAPGDHTLRMVAIDAAGNSDPTPAVKRFTVIGSA